MKSKDIEWTWEVKGSEGMRKNSDKEEESEWKVKPQHECFILVILPKFNVCNKFKKNLLFKKWGKSHFSPIFGHTYKFSV